MIAQVSVLSDSWVLSPVDSWVGVEVFWSSVTVGLGVGVFCGARGNFFHAARPAPHTSRDACWRTQTPFDGKLRLVHIHFAIPLYLRSWFYVSRLVWP